MTPECGHISPQGDGWAIGLLPTWEGDSQHASTKPLASRAAAQSQTEAAYSRWAPVYDLIFDLPFHPGRSAAARAANAAAGPNGDMLVVGVGTGLELSLLSHTARVTGIDLSRRC